ncbi:MAG: hypothetical protein GX491_16170 [Chloroflexi bacterium]|nr:hypothetical protein [Chloroflexota bacterium]
MAEFDFDLHGEFRLRLIDATEKEAAVVTRQLGPVGAPPGGDPDVIIRFVDQMPDSGGMRYIGLNDSAFTPDSFLVLKGKHKSRVKVMIPFDKIGQQPEIICERGLSSIPFLVAIVNLTLLSKGILPLHASAFTYQGKGALITGWAKGGKTEILLAFMSRGASYVGDEWIYLRPDGESMFGIPEPIRVWDWHLDSLPHYRARLKRKEQLKLRSLEAVSRSMDWFLGSSGQPVGPVKWMARVSPIVKQQMYTHFPPRTLFGDENCRDSASIDRVIFTASHQSDEIAVSPYDPEEVAQRMVFSLAYEQQEFYAAYLKFRFAFPDRQNYWLNHAERIQAKLLSRLLQGKETLSVLHPYPVHIPALFDALCPYF